MGVSFCTADQVKALPGCARLTIATELLNGCCQTNENSHRIAGAALIYALNSWRHSARAAVRLSLKLSRE